jgi:hypothetical protein
MSIAHLQSIFEKRTGRDVLPENLPIDVLISLTRELVYMDEGKLDHAELRQLHICLRDFVERLLGMQPVCRLRIFNENVDEMLPGLVTELNNKIRDELVNRLIGHSSARPQLEEAFEEYFLEKRSST